tara:strand:+ start:744 stop:1016 length:273 start_codon:yes stop_codon:yes gene_type:complete
MAKSKEMFCETKTINVDGKEMDLIRFTGDANFKIHNWEKPAIRDYSSGRVKRQYFLYGIEYSEEAFKESVKERSGLPWFKNPSMQLNARF